VKYSCGASSPRFQLWMAGNMWVMTGSCEVLRFARRRRN
jgi:hypothetical protein